MDATGNTTNIEKPSLSQARNSACEPLSMTRTMTEKTDGEDADNLLHAYYARMNALHERLNLEIYN